LPTTTKTRAHFKHLAGAAADAECPGSARMSVEHLAAQENIARALKWRHPDAVVRLEAIYDADRSGRAGRSDILLEPRSGAPLCVEVQASTLPVADLQERTASRAAEGYVVEWIFLVDLTEWTKPLKLPEMLNIVLKTRGYLYLLEDPMTVQPQLRVAVAPWISAQVPDLRTRYLPRGHAHLLWKPRPVRDFTLVGAVPGAAGLRCEGLHQPLERWLRDGQRALDREQPRDVPRQAPTMERWQDEHERLERELARADTSRAAALRSLQQASADVTATATAVAAAQISPRPPAPDPRLRRRDRLWRWLRPRPRAQQDAFWSMPPARDDRAEKLAASVRARIGALRDELARRDIDHQAAGERLAEHVAQRAAAEQIDDDRHAAALEAARVEREQRLRPRHKCIEGCLLVLPSPHREPAAR